MDSFDDLLTSSSRSLEHNPFADPFANARSGSPDPWAAFGQSDEGIRNVLKMQSESPGASEGSPVDGNVALQSQLDDFGDEQQDDQVRSRIRLGLLMK